MIPPIVTVMAAAAAGTAAALGVRKAMEAFGSDEWLSEMAEVMATAAAAAYGVHKAAEEI